METADNPVENPWSVTPVAAKPIQTRPGLWVYILAAGSIVFSTVSITSLMIVAGSAAMHKTVVIGMGKHEIDIFGWFWGGGSIYFSSAAMVFGAIVRRRVTGLGLLCAVLGSMGIILRYAVGILLELTR